MSNIRIIEESEVFWAMTKEYTLDIDGENIECKIAENSNGVEFFEWTHQAGWEEADINSGIMKVIYEAWADGEIVL